MTGEGAAGAQLVTNINRVDKRIAWVQSELGDCRRVIMIFSALKKKDDKIGPF
jgi:hypothetical protein